MNEFIFYVTEGFNHVIDFRAYDHILFFILMALPLAFSGWQRILRLSLAFTMGHTLSIILSYYNIIKPDVALVEFLIVASIAATGLYNLLIAGKRTSTGRDWLMLAITLVFGLIHGFGFASAFKMLASGAEHHFLLLLEFALGIELGQLLVVFVVLGLGFLLHRVLRVARRDWVLVVSALVLGIVLPLLAERWPL